MASREPAQGSGRFAHESTAACFPGGVSRPTEKSGHSTPRALRAAEMSLAVTDCS